MVIDKEALRTSYNMRYSKRVDRWSCHSLKKAKKIVDMVLFQLSRLGITLQKKNSLDVGCAKGHIAEALRMAGFESYGIDYADVAIQIAKQNFPKCHFLHMDGFDPCIETSFDLIFCRGFSGANTHNLQFVADWVNRYLRLLNPYGCFVLAYTSDFSGKEESNETACWGMNEINELSNMLFAKRLPIFFIDDEENYIHTMKKLISKYILKHKVKKYFYISYLRHIN
jgi:hypothetical protein